MHFSCGRIDQRDLVFNGQGAGDRVRADYLDCASAGLFAIAMNITAYQLAERFVGTKETAGATSTPVVLAMLQLDGAWPADDSVPWCSAFLNWIAWLLRLPRSKSLAARSWLAVGTPVALEDALPGFDVVILKRGKGLQPGADVLNAPGHVGLFAGLEGTAVNTKVLLLAGNQGDAVSVQPFKVSDVLGVRRLLQE